MVILPSLVTVNGFNRSHGFVFYRFCRPKDISQKAPTIAAKIPAAMAEQSILVGS
jgi:hypothetical protein